MKYEQLTNNIIGIYKIVFPNDKVYIGLSNNIKRRIKEHWQDERGKNMPCYSALHKYYNNLAEIEIEILETFDIADYNILSEREVYWIKEYKANDKYYGYNITPGGYYLKAFDSPRCKFKPNDIDRIYEMLLDGHSNKKIAELFKVAPDTIGKINNGQTYKKEGYTFPLRNTRKMKDFIGYENANSLSKEKVSQIINLLKTTDLTYNQIAEKENISYPLVFKINQGKMYKEDNELYPIRKSRNNRNLPLTKEKVFKIKEELRKTAKTLKQLAEEYECSYSAIVSLNDGKTFYDEKQQYPIRISKLHPKKPVSTISESGEQGYY